MVVEVAVYYWSPAGMISQDFCNSRTRYVLLDDMERLLEEAHARGYREGKK